MSELRDADGEWGERYRHLVEEADDMLYLLDEDGNYALVNDAMAEMTGYDKSAIIGNSPSMLLSEEDLAQGQHRIRHLLESEAEQSDTWTVTIITKEGNRIPCELRFTLLPMTGGGYNGIAGVARDIRQRRRREQKLQVMTRVLRHNIRNKLGLVIGKANLIGERAMDDNLTAEDILEMTDNIADNAEEMVRLSEKVRTIQERIRSRPENEARTEVVKLARAVVQQFRAEHSAAELTIDAPAEAWATVSETYDVALSELIENGIMHHEGEGAPAVHVEIRETNGVLRTAVYDNCPSIPEVEKRVIRNEEETALSHSAGVGLWLVYWVVKAANGQMEFGYSSEGNRVDICFETADPL
jgi:PAS domain S-box-containing protein